MQEFYHESINDVSRDNSRYCYTYRHFRGTDETYDEWKVWSLKIIVFVYAFFLMMIAKMDTK